MLHALCTPAHAAAAGTAEQGSSGNLTWNYADGVLTISGNGPMEDFGWDYDMPWAHLAEQTHTLCIEEGVTSVGELAFIDFKSLCTVTLPNSLTKISGYSFFRCDNLETIYSADLMNTLPVNLEYLGTCAFTRCYSLTQITFPSGLTEIPDSSFYLCSNLRSVYIPSTISYIAVDAFGYCYNLKYIYFEGNAPEIHESAFVSYDGSEKTVAYYPAGNSTWTEDKLLNYGRNLIWKSTSESFTPSDTGGESLDWYLSDDGTLVINGNGPMNDFLFCDAPWADLADKVHTICIIDGVTTIGAYAFEDFTELSTVRLPNTLVEIGDYAFSYCVQLAWVLNSDLEQRIPDNAITIGEGAFQVCLSISELTLGRSVSEIGQNAFASCVSMKQIVLSPSLTTIGDGAFRDCNALSTISIPDGVTYIGENAFSACTNLKEFVFHGDAPYIHNQAFAEGSETLHITAYYPVNNASWSADLCKDYGAVITRKTKPADCISIGACGDNLTWELKQNGSLYIKGEGAMYNYDTIDYPPWYSFKEQITAVIIEDGVATIGNTAFYKCTQIQSVKIADCVTNIGDIAFFDCESLISVQISANVTSIGYAAF